MRRVGKYKNMQMAESEATAEKEYRPGQREL